MAQIAAEAVELPGGVARSRTWSGVRRIFFGNASVMIGSIVLIVILAAAILAPWIAPYDPTTQSMLNRLKPPGVPYLLGTDTFGRDILSRLIWGARISLLVGLSSVSIALVVGIVYGSVSGYYAGKVDSVMMLFNDALLALPSLLLALTVYAAFGQARTSLVTIVVAISVSMMPGFARLIRGSVLQARGLDYVQAASVLGASAPRIIFIHILPNVIAPMIVWGTLRIAIAMLIESSMSFLGVGVQPPTPTWGNIAAEGRQVLQLAPWVTSSGGVAILVTCLALNIVGDAVRDAFDPRMRSE